MIEQKHVDVNPEQFKIAGVNATKDPEPVVPTVEPLKINNLPPEFTVPREVSIKDLTKLVDEEVNKPLKVDTFPEIEMKSDSPFKYKEDEILRELENYLLSTYGQHYSGKNGTQVQDLVLAGDTAETIGFWKWNAVKYMARYGKKNGRNRTDIIKAIHYCMLMLYLDGLLNEQGEKQ